MIIILDLIINNKNERKKVGRKYHHDEVIQRIARGLAVQIGLVKNKKINYDFFVENISVFDGMTINETKRIIDKIYDYEYITENERNVIAKLKKFELWNDYNFKYHKNSIKLLIGEILKMRNSDIAIKSTFLTENL